MKNQSIVVALAIVMTVLMPNHLLAQVVPMTQEQTVTMSVSSSALIKVVNMDGSGSTNVSLTLGGPAQAGMAVTPVTENTSTRLRMSSLATGPLDKREITAVITGAVDMQYSKTKLQLELAPPAPANSGNFINYDPDGNGETGLQTLGDDTGNADAVTLVSDIQTCWTGTEPGDGYIIRYVYQTDGLGTPTARTVTVTFTIQAQV